MTNGQGAAPLGDDVLVSLDERPGDSTILTMDRSWSTITSRSADVCNTTSKGAGRSAYHRQESKGASRRGGEGGCRRADPDIGMVFPCCTQFTFLFCLVIDGRETEGASGVTLGGASTGVRCLLGMPTLRYRLHVFVPQV
ncbi:hypothetical protein MRX96_047872 [Rhipicephalus microplus]